jgi:hypothetical protein
VMSPLVTEYEALLQQMLDERRGRLEELKNQRGKEKAIEELRSDMRFIEVELERYQKGLALFRTKSVPKVGRWGKPEPAEKPGGH